MNARAMRPVSFFCFMIGLFLICLLPKSAYSELIGGEFGYTLGGSTGPFDTELDLYFNGTLDLPIYQTDPLFGNKLMAEIMVGHARSRTEVSSVSTGGETSDKLQITTFHLFVGFKYKLDKLGKEGSLTRRIQPYLIAGPLFNLFLCRTDVGTCGADSLAPELREKGITTGSGDVRFDYSFGGGVDVVLTEQFFVGADLRHSFSSPRARYTIFGGRAGFLF